jgi:hypothetical protein
MLVLPLCRKYCPEKLTMSVGQYINDGSDGHCFLLGNDKNKVIKFSILFGERINRYATIEQVLSQLVAVKPRAYVRVHEYGYLGTFSRPWEEEKTGIKYKSNQDFVLHYYIMDRLEDLSKDEREVFNHIFANYGDPCVLDLEALQERNFRTFSDLSEADLATLAIGTGLDFDARVISLFCQEIAQSPIKQEDLHDLNIMRNKLGEYKIIDIDRCSIIQPLEKLNVEVKS